MTRPLSEIARLAESLRAIAGFARKDNTLHTDDVRDLLAAADALDAAKARIAELERLAVEDNVTSNDIADYAEKQLRRLALADRLAEAVEIWQIGGQTGISYYDRPCEKAVDAALAAYRDSKEGAK